MISKKFKKIFSLFNLLAVLLFFCSNNAYALASNNTKKLNNEIVSERDEYTKKYQNTDGSVTANIYTSPIHYKDENGNWQDINNLLTINKDEANYVNEDSPLDISLSTNSSNNNMVSITNDEYSLSWGIQNVNAVEGVINNSPTESPLKNLTSEITYANVFANSTLKYTLSSYSLMEELIFNDVPNYDNVIYNVTCNNLKARVESNEVVFYTDNEEEKEIFKFSVPFMYDSSEEPQINMNVGVSLEETETGYKITHNFDMDWLKSEDRVYPIVLDPVVTSYQNYSNIEDTHTNSGSPNTNFVNNPYLQIGKINGTNYVFVKITNLPNIPSGATINSASLGLYLNYGSSSWGALSIHELRNSWNSFNLTWNNQGTLVNNAPVLANGIYPSATGGYYKYNIDVTSTYRKWYSGTLGNYGFMLRYQDVNYNDCNWIYSSDNLGIGSSYLPAITVNYTEGGDPYKAMNWFYPLPTNNTTITDTWREWHNAMDISAVIGTPVYATTNGRVKSIIPESLGYSIGNGIAIQTNDIDPETGTYLLVDYGHLSSILVSYDQPVSKGQLIGYSGNSGGSSAHLQIAVSRNGVIWPNNQPSDFPNTVNPARFWF